MFRAMRVLAFKVYLRVDEMVPRAPSARHSPQFLHAIGDCIPGSPIYLVNFFESFCQLGGNIQSSFFTNANGSPMLRCEFDVSLRRLLSVCGYQNTSFQGHTFRIGAATVAALRGESDSQIRAADRWTSDAVRKYIRMA